MNGQTTSLAIFTMTPVITGKTYKDQTISYPLLRWISPFTFFLIFSNSESEK